MDDLVAITVIGTPTPQGSKRAYVRGGRAMLVESAGDRLKTWRSAVVDAARDAMNDRPPLEGPLTASICFTMPRPKSLPKRSTHWPHKRPDIDKLLRATLDPLTDAGVWLDDAQVVAFTTLCKLYTGHGAALDVPGARIYIRPIEGTP